ncbi:putative uncharacterized protein DDB_G0294196 [Quercus lobata]|uniref:DUF1421 domain-containing protein n=1 Tax=Quercus lobata TaxID=97700 RepID=A0A7N2RBH6_QUELO|nr:putative uncharacterized protein DDB_G0294196 [Quercus lobata]
MRSSEFMDKQITELSRSHSQDFSLFSNPHHHHHHNDDDDDDDDELSPTFRFHPIRPFASTQSHADDSESLISVIDRKMKELGENLMHAVEGISARLTQLENRTRRIENSVDDLKDSIESRHGSSDGKLRELHNILTQVQGGIQDLKDKQEIAEAQLQLAKLQMSKDNQQSQNKITTGQSNSAQEPLSSAPQQSHQPVPIPVASPQQLPALPFNVFPNVPLQNSSPTSPATAAQIPTQLSQNPIPSLLQPESYYSTPVHTQESTHQQYHLPPMQQPPPPPYQHYHPEPQLPPISQVSQPPQQHPSLGFVNPQVHCPSSHHPEEIPYMPSQSYPPSNHRSPQAPGIASPSQQYYLGSSQQMQDQPSRDPNFGFPSSSRHSQPPGHSHFYEHSYSGYPSHYNSSTMKPLQSGESSNSRLPTAQILPHALPISSSVDDGSSSSGTRDSIPTDDVVDKVVVMGFRRDLVRATVRKLTETGQSVDLNVVLDRMMNDGELESHGSRFGK